MTCDDEWPATGGVAAAAAEAEAEAADAGAAVVGVLFDDDAERDEDQGGIGAHPRIRNRMRCANVKTPLSVSYHDSSSVTGYPKN